MRIKRGGVVSSLAFIDVMACGLGAVMLLFFIIDFDDTEPVEAESIAAPLAEKSVVHTEDRRKAQLVEQIARARQDVDQLQSDLSEAIVGQIEAQMKVDAIPKSSPSLSKKPRERVYSGDLVGLKVEGTKILILFDVSASMSENKLIDIIVGTSDPSGTRLAQGGKWATAKDILRWVVDNAPEQSSMKLISFSEEANLHTDQWVSKSSLNSVVGRTAAGLKPEGGTNLGSALQLAADKARDADSVYLITDGLPTLKGKGTSLLTALISCGLGGSGYVSGECREAYFESAVNRYSRNSAAQVSVILLPLEGDPRAAPLYWSWAKRTGGMIFSPAEGWP
jgi:hypothetical protein